MNDAIQQSLPPKMTDEAANQTAGIRRISRIGDCYGPGPIAAAVFGGYRYARRKMG